VHDLANVARIVLVLSLALELLAGVFLNHPIDILGIQGNIASLGPIQGIFGTRNALGFTAVMAIVTFVIEWRANTVSPWLSLGSVVLAGALALLTGSPIVLVVAIAGAVATSVLLMVRHTRAPYRSAVQWTLGAAVLAGIVLAYLLRQRLITLIGADNDIDTRYDLWLTVLRFVRTHPFRGWGWFGPWIPGDMPFSAINASLGTTNLSALNAFFDALLQLGWIGFVLFFALCATAFVRSWIDASDRRSVVYAWTPLVLVALIVYSFFESFALSGFGWLLLVVCATRAYEHQSLWEWRGRLGRM
jgi:exopolysaccharide production protein ExoQ